MEFGKLPTLCEHPPRAIKIDNPPVLTRITYDSAVSHAPENGIFYRERVCCFSLRCERKTEADEEVGETKSSISPIQSLIPVYPSLFKFSSRERRIGKGNKKNVSSKIARLHFARARTTVLCFLILFFTFNR